MLIESCGICLEYYKDKIRAPHTLQCGHTFCHECLTKISSKNDGVIVECPHCRKIVNQQLKDIGKNYAILEII